MDRTWITFIVAAAIFAWGAGPRIAIPSLAVFLLAVAIGICALEAAGTGLTLREAAAATHAPRFFLLMLVPSAAGVLIGWGFRRLAPPRRRGAPWMTRDR